MRRLVVPVIAALAVLISACGKQSSVNSPTTSDGSAMQVQKMIQTINFTPDQMAMVDEMFYAGEDLRLILPTAQVDAIECVTGTGTGIMGDNSMMGRRMVVDMDALIWLQLVSKANPDLDRSTIDAIRTLIADNFRLRADAIRNTSDPAALKALLTQLHEKLIADINALLTPDQIAKAQALRDLIAKQQEELRQKMDALRIDMQVRMMTQALGLTPAQTDAVKALLTQQLKDIAALRTQYAGDPEGFRLALQTLMTQYDSQLQQILGPDLWTKWLAIRSGRMGMGGGRAGGMGGGMNGGGMNGGGRAGGMMGSHG